MDQPQCIYRSSPDSLFGISATQDSEIVLTLQDSGVHLFNVDRQENSSLWLLGDSGLTFTASAVLDPSNSVFTAAVCQKVDTVQPGRQDTLLSWPADGPTGTLANVAHRTALPGCVHSLYTLQSAASAAHAAATENTLETDLDHSLRQSNVAVVFCDGSARTVTSLQASQQSNPAQIGSRMTVAACSFSEDLAVISTPAQPEDPHVQADIYSFQMGRLQLKACLRLPLPQQGASVASASLHADSLTVVWSTGVLHVFSLSSRSSALHTAPQDPVEGLLLSFCRLAVDHHTSVSTDPAQTAAALPSTPISHGRLPNGFVQPTEGSSSGRSSRKNRNGRASSRKRKEAEAESEAVDTLRSIPEGSALLASSSIAEGSVALASWGHLDRSQPLEEQPVDHEGGLRLSLFDTCYGGVQHSQLIPGLHVPSRQSSLKVAACPSGGQLALQLDGDIYAAQLQATPPSLAALVGCYAPGCDTVSGRAAQAVLNLSASVPAQRPHAQPSWSAAAPAAADSPADADVAVPLQSSWNPRSAGDASQVFQAAQDRLTGAAMKAAACSTAVLELLQSIQAAHTEIPASLHAKAILTCAHSSCWHDLEQLLQYQPLSSLSLVPGLAPLLISHGRHSMLASLLPQAQDLGADDIASGLQSLLLPSAASKPSSTADYAQQLRGRAERAVEAAEACSSSTDRPQLVGAASVATAAVDGFSDQEIALHPLVTMHHDGTILTAALSQLSQRQAAALLRYLLQWMRHHAGLLQHLAAPSAAASSGLQGVVVPQLRSVLLWLAATIDAHMVSLSMHASSHKVLEQLQDVTANQLQNLNQLVGLRGVLDHLKCRAPLPTGHSMALATYAIEVLDLRVI